VSVAELLERLEKLQAKKDIQQLRKFVEKLDGLLLKDADNRELLQLRREAESGIASLDATAGTSAAAAAVAAAVAATIPPHETEGEVFRKLKLRIYLLY
jgi:predicted ribonuclease YlaK